MTGPNGFDRRLTAWLDEQAPMREPDDLLEATSGRIARTRRLPGWAIPERWLPMQTTAKLGAIPRTAIALVTLGLLLIVFTALAIGSGSSPEPKLPPPFGLARNGLIAFDSGGDIWVANADGTEPRYFVTGPGFDINPVWSPDGTRLSFLSLDTSPPRDAAQPTAAQVTEAINTSRSASLMYTEVSDAGPSQPKVLADGIDPDEWAFPASWSPDSERVVYCRVEDGDTVIEVVSIDGGTPTRVTSGSSPAWSPDGRSITYKSPDTRGVMVVGADGTDPHRITAAPGSGSGPFTGPQWSPDGRYIAFYSGAFDISLASPDGVEEFSIAEDPAQEYWPAWSPDGSRIAFDRVIDSGRNLNNPVIADRDGKNARMLETTPLMPAGPVVWSPDGLHVLGYPADPGGAASPNILILETARAIQSDSIPGIAVPSALLSASWQRLALP